MTIFPLFNLVYFKDGFTPLGFYNYIDEYIILFVPTIIGITLFFLKKEKIIILSIVCISVLFSFFCFEFYLINSLQNKNNIGDKNETKLYDEFLKKKSKGIQGLHIPPIYFLDNTKSKKILPLSNTTNSSLIVCNENDYYSTIKTDRFGFNNPDKEWDKNKFNFIFLGDSFTDGYCVNEKDSIPGNFRSRSFDGGILNLGVGGNGPLLQYATLKEYFPNKNVDIVYWIYYHGNDLADLNTELRNNILKKYFNEIDYKQNLINRKKELEKKLKHQNEILLKFYKKVSLDQKKPFQFKNLIKLTYSRMMFGDFIENYINLNPPEEFLEILNNTNKFLTNNNTELIFIYLPNVNNIKPNEKFVNKIKKLDIKVIDIGDKLKNYKDKRSLFPKSGIYHFNEFGYKIISDIIIENSGISLN